MGAGCDLTGRTQQETLQHELKWMSEWALDLLRVAKAQHGVLSQIYAMHSISHSRDDLDPLVRMDAIGAIASGGCTLGKNFEFGIYRMNSNDRPTHQSLENSFQEMHAQGEGKMPIPVHNWTHETEPVKPVTKEDAKAFEKAFWEFIHGRQKMQELFDKYFTGTVDPEAPPENPVDYKHRRPYVQVKMRVVDSNEDQVEPKGFNLKELVEAANKSVEAKK